MHRSRATARLSVLALVGLALFIWLNWFPPGYSGDSESMQPEAPVALGREEAAERAVQFVRSQFAVRDPQPFVMYDGFEAASGYWLKERLADTYEQHWSAIVPMSYYRVLVTDNAAALTFEVLLSGADGQVFGWTLRSGSGVPADVSLLDSSGHESAAAAWLRQLGYDPLRFRMSEEGIIVSADGSKTYPYIYDTQVGEARLLLNLRISGDVLTGITPRIELPPSYSAWKDAQDRQGAQYGLLSLVFMAMLAVGAMICLGVYRRSMSFSRGVLLTLAFAVPYLLHNVNMYPAWLLMSGFEGAGALVGLMFYQFVTLLMAIAVYVCLAAGDGMWRRMGFSLWPAVREPLFERRVMSAVGKGYLLSAVVLGAQSVMYYAAAEWFGVWSTSRPEESVHNLLAPGLYPLLAWSASISEEAIFRLFAIVIVCWLLRPVGALLYRITGLSIMNHPLVYVVPAVVISSMIWAIGHMGYSIYPVYTRFVEVTALGFIFAYALIRYGLLTAIFAHATVDLIIMGFQIMQAGESNVLAGLLYMIMPLVVAWLARLLASMWRHSGRGQPKRIGE